jgi:hypothetical protein
VQQGAIGAAVGRVPQVPAAQRRRERHQAAGGTTWRQTTTGAGSARRGRARTGWRRLARHVTSGVRPSYPAAKSRPLRPRSVCTSSGRTPRLISGNAFPHADDARLDPRARTAAPRGPAGALRTGAAASEPNVCWRRRVRSRARMAAGLWPEVPRRSGRVPPP